MSCYVKLINDIWNVPLGNTHSAFSNIEFKRGRTSPEYEVLIVDTKKFIQLYENNFDSLKPIPKVNQWESAKTKGISDFLKPGNGYPEMPRVSFTYESSKSGQKLPVLIFGNGRHRVRYLEYADAICFPLEVNAKGRVDLELLCGAILCGGVNQNLD